MHFQLCISDENLAIKNSSILFLRHLIRPVIFLSPAVPGIVPVLIGTRWPGCVCHFGTRTRVCDLHRHSLREALTEVFPRFREMEATNPDYLRRCAVYFLKGLCEQCPAKSWMESGTLDTPVEYLCDVAHAQARYLGLTGVEEKAWEVTDGRERVERFAQKAR